jgi:hypothetical protein
VRSERQLVREIKVNVAYRWFLQLKLTDGVFDASTLSQNRRFTFLPTVPRQGGKACEIRRYFPPIRASRNKNCLKFSKAFCIRHLNIIVQLPRMKVRSETKD